MAIRGALALMTLSLVLILALSGIAQAVPKAYRAYVAILFFPGFFFVIGITLRFADARIGSLSELVSALKDGKDMFLSWSTYLLALILVSGAVSYTLF